MPAVLAFSVLQQLELKNVFDTLLFLGYKWSKIAIYLKVSRRTVYRYRDHIQYVERLANITDDELDEIIVLFIANHPETGKLRNDFVVTIIM